MQKQDKCIIEQLHELSINNSRESQCIEHNEQLDDTLKHSLELLIKYGLIETVIMNNVTGKIGYKLTSFGQEIAYTAEINRDSQ